MKNGPLDELLTSIPHFPGLSFKMSVFTRILPGRIWTAYEPGSCHRNRGNVVCRTGSSSRGRAPSGGGRGAGTHGDSRALYPDSGLDCGPGGASSCLFSCEKKKQNVLRNGEVFFRLPHQCSEPERASYALFYEEN